MKCIKVNKTFSTSCDTYRFDKSFLVSFVLKLEINWTINSNCTKLLFQYEQDWGYFANKNVFANCYKQAIVSETSIVLLSNQTLPVVPKRQRAMYDWIRGDCAKPNLTVKYCQGRKSLPHYALKVLLRRKNLFRYCI